eukprot:158588_1
MGICCCRNDHTSENNAPLITKQSSKQSYQTVTNDQTDIILNTNQPQTSCCDHKETINIESNTTRCDRFKTAHSGITISNRHNIKHKPATNELLRSQRNNQYRKQYNTL